MTAKDKVKEYEEACALLVGAAEHAECKRPKFVFSGTFCSIVLEYDRTDKETGAYGWLLNGWLTNTAQLCDLRNLLNELFPEVVKKNVLE